MGTMNKAYASLIAVAIIFAGCAPIAQVSPREITTFTPDSAVTLATPMGTATPRPVLILNQDTSLFSGPGNTDFDVMYRLKAGDIIYPIAAFGDFF